MYLIDTSVWIPTLRKDGIRTIQETVSQMIQENEAATTAIIKVELLSGCRESELAALQNYVKGLRLVSLTEEQYDQAGMLGYKLKRKGVTIGAPDLIIAVASLTSGSTLVHADSDFEQIATVSPELKRINYAKQVHAWQKSLLKRDNKS